MPAEEARAVLYAGNMRYVTGNGGLATTFDAARMALLADDGQQPMAIILGSADSRCPIDALFDARPGDAFVLRTLGNTPPSDGGILVGSVEYGVQVLNSKFICVTGQTRCPAITDAVETVIAGSDTSSVPGSIGNVYDAVYEVPTPRLQPLDLPDDRCAHWPCVQTGCVTVRARRGRPPPSR